MRRDRASVTSGARPPGRVGGGEADSGHVDGSGDPSKGIRAGASSTAWLVTI
jgi:hypothetical protein